MEYQIHFSEFLKHLWWPTRKELLGELRSEPWLKNRWLVGILNAIGSNHYGRTCWFHTIFSLFFPLSTSFIFPCACIWTCLFDGGQWIKPPTNKLDSKAFPFGFSYPFTSKVECNWMHPNRSDWKSASQLQGPVAQSKTEDTRWSHVGIPFKVSILSDEANLLVLVKMMHRWWLSRSWGSCSMLPYQISNSSAGSTTQDTLKLNSLSFLPGLLKADQPLFALLSDFQFWIYYYTFVGCISYVDSWASLFHKDA